MADTLRILLVDGRAERRELLAIVLDAALHGCRVDAVSDPFELADLLRAGQASAVVAAHPSPWFEGFGLIERIRQALPAQPVILLADEASEQTASAALRAGIADLVVHDASAPLRVRDALVRALAAASISSAPTPETITEAPVEESPVVRTPTPPPQSEQPPPASDPGPSLARSSQLADAPTAIMKALDRKVDRQSTEIPTEVGRRGLKALIERARVGWLRCDPEGLLIDCNDALLQLMEARRGDIRLTRLGLQRSRWTSFMKAIRSDGAVTETGVELRTLRGGHRVVSLTLRGSSAGRDEPAIDGLVVLAPSAEVPAEGEGELIELDEHRQVRDDEATLIDHRLLGLSHDLQEPLRTVRIYADLLEEKHAGTLDDEARLMLHRSRDAAARMEEMVSDMVGEATVVRSAPRTADCEEVLRGVLVNLAAAITASDAEVSHDRLPVVRLPSRQMAQLLQNLVGNAIKYRSDASPRVHISAERAEAEWVFTVTDNGMGISEDDQERVFEMFERASSGANRPGSGIGLAVCRRLVEGYGGRIWVESTPGEGSTFQFSVPGLPEEKQAQR